MTLKGSRRASRWRGGSSPTPSRPPSAADSSGNSHAATATSVTFGSTNEAVPPNTSASFASGSVQSHALSSYNPSGLDRCLRRGVGQLQQPLAGRQRARASSLTAQATPTADSKGVQLMVSSNAGRACSSGSATARLTATPHAWRRVPASGWTYLAGTYDGANVRLYVNATLVTTSPFTGTIARRDRQPGSGLGYNPAYSGDFLNGLLAEARRLRHGADRRADRGAVLQRPGGVAHAGCWPV